MLWTCMLWFEEQQSSDCKHQALNEAFTWRFVRLVLILTFHLMTQVLDHHLTSYILMDHHLWGSKLWTSRMKFWRFIEDLNEDWKSTAWDLIITFWLAVFLLFHKLWYVAPAARNSDRINLTGSRRRDLSRIWKDITLWY